MCVDIFVNFCGNFGRDIYREIKCGLAHASLIEGNTYVIIEGGNCGILYDRSSGSYTFYVRQYFEDFKKAVNKYISGLESGVEDFTKVKDALKDKPESI